MIMKAICVDDIPRQGPVDLERGVIYTVMSDHQDPDVLYVEELNQRYAANRFKIISNVNRRSALDTIEGEAVLIAWGFSGGPKEMKHAVEYIQMYEAIAN